MPAPSLPSHPQPAYNRTIPDFPATLALLKPDDLWPAWKLIGLLEKAGEMDADEAQQWRDGIYRLMMRWKLEPSHLTPPTED